MKTISLISTGTQTFVLNGLSADGRYVLFGAGIFSQFKADSFFIKDSQTGQVTLAAADHGDNETHGDALISQDGEFVAYSALDDSGSPYVETVNIFDKATGQTRTVFSHSEPVDNFGITTVEAISADDQSIFFTSSDPDLIGDTTDSHYDLFQLNVQTGAVQTLLVGSSSIVSVAAGGRYIVTSADNGSGGQDLYRVDLTTGDLDVVQAGGGSYTQSSVSADGRFVVFSTFQALLPEDTDGVADIYLKDMSTGQLRLVSTTASGVAEGADDSGLITSDGSKVIFETSASFLTPGATGEILVSKDLATGAITLLLDAQELSNSSGEYHISADGNSIALQTGVSLVAGDTDGGKADVYLVHFTQPVLTVNAISGDNLINATESTVTVTGTSDAIGQTVFLSVPGDPGAGHTATAVVHSNGTWSATLNIGHPADGGYNVEAVVTDGLTTTVDHPFTVDATPPTLIVDPVTGDNIVNAIEAPAFQISGTSDAHGQTVTLSIDNKFVGFTTVGQNGGWSFQYNGANLSDGQHQLKLSVADAAGNLTSDVDPIVVDKTPPKIGITGIGDNFVVNASEYRHGALVTGTSDEIGGTVHITDPSGNQAEATVAADGKWQTTAYFSGDLSGPNQFTATITDAAGNAGTAHATALVDSGIVDVSAATPGADDNLYGYYDPSVSGNGQYVAYDDGFNVYVKNLLTGTYTIVNQTIDGQPPDGTLYGSPVLSQDGQSVAYYSYADNLVAGDTNGGLDVFISYLDGSPTQRVDTTAAGDQIVGIGNDSPLGPPAISADGKWVAFTSDAGGLIPGVSGETQIYRKNTRTGDIDLVSADSAGNQLTGKSFDPSISADGTMVTFTTDGSDNARPSDIQNYIFVNPADDVFVKDMSTEALTLVSQTPQGGTPDGTSVGSVISPDGHYVEFTSLADDLVPSDPFFTRGLNTFVAHLVNGQVVNTVSLTDGISSPGVGGQGTFSFTSDNGLATFDTETNIDPADPGNESDSYIADLSTGDISFVLGFGAQLSANGHYVAFYSELPLTADSRAHSGIADIYLQELQPHSLTFAPVTGDNVIGASEVHSVPLSGTTDLTSGTVTISVDGAQVTTTAIGSGGAWSATIDMSTFAATSHTILATARDDAGFAIDAAEIVDIPVASGQTIAVTSGQTGSGQTVQSGGHLVVSSGGSDVSPILSSGGSEVVSSGGTTINTAISSGGALTVSSGGVADPSTINSGGSEVINAGGTDLGAIVSGGKLVNFGITSGVTVFAGGSQIVRAGGVASATLVLSGGVFSDLGSAFATEVRDGGTDFVQSAGVETGAILSSGGTEFIEPHGLANGLTLLSGSLLADFGSASGTVIWDGGLDFIEAGGSETGATLMSGGTEFIEAGGIANGLTVSEGGLVTNFGSASGTVVQSDGLDYVQANGVETGATLSAGGVEYVEAGGKTVGLMVLSGGIVANYGGSESGTIVQSDALDYVEAAGSETGAILSGGIEYIFAGAVTNNLTVSNDGIFANYGGLESGTLVSNGGTDFVEVGGTETGATLFSGGIEYIESGAITNSLTVSNGGIATNYGGSASGTITRSGGLDYVEASAVETGGVLSNGGIGYVFAGGTMNALTVSSGGIFANHGGAASGTVIGNGGTDFVEAGGTETGAAISSGGFEYVEVGGRTGNIAVSGGGNLINYGSGLATAIKSAGTEYVESGAIESGASVSNGGVEYIYAGGTANGLTVSSGGNAANHGVESGTIVSAGGTNFIESGAVETGGTLSSGGVEFIEPGGTAIGLTVLNGGIVDNQGGSASGTMISAGGTNFIESGAVETGGTLSSGGVEFIEPGGTAIGLTVLNSGIVDNQGGSASGTMISAGGQDYLEAGAVETGATLFTGGAEFIQPGGTASGLTISGGLADLTSGGVISGTVTFMSSGELQLADSQDFTNLVAGFSGTSVKMDLQDITYVSGATTVDWSQTDSTSGTLTVSGGGHAANITLIGQYATGNFAISSDGAGGTLVVDPPIPPTDNATVLVHPRAA